MSYALRNTLVLLVLLLVISGLGSYFVFSREGKVLRQKEQALVEQTQRATQLDSLTVEVESLTTEVTDGEVRWATRMNVLPASDVTSETNRNFNAILEGAPLKLSVLASANAPHGDYGYMRYLLRGEGNFIDMYRFLFGLENHERLYRVESVKLKEVQVVEANEFDNEDTAPRLPRSQVTFETIIRAYYSSVSAMQEPLSPEAMAMRVTNPGTLPVNPMKPLLLDALPPNIDDLVEVDRSTLASVAGQTAYVRDQGGALQALEVGDPVYLGFVTAIRPSLSEVEFTLNRGGLVQRVVLHVPFLPED